MDVKDDVKAIVKAAQLLFNLVLYFHMMACIWFFVCDYNKIWTPSVTWSHDYKEMYGAYYEEYPLSQRVLIAWYTSVIMIRGNEWGPRTVTELIFGTFVLLLDLIIAANIFAQMAVFV